MSELTPCNFCSLARVKARAKEEGKKVTVLADAKWGLGGYNVYVHPKSVKIADLPGGEDGARSEYRSSWMMEIGNKCGC